MYYILFRQLMDQLQTIEFDKKKKAKKDNETLECEICCQEDLLLDDMVECTVGHLYCR